MIPRFFVPTLHATHSRMYHAFFLPLQYGHLPYPVLLLCMIASHACPFLHCHQTLLLLPGVTSLGVNLPFSTGCHSAARGGFTVCRQLSSHTARPAQQGHPLPLFLLEIVAFHSWPLPQIHQAFLSEFGVTSIGVNRPFLVGCHCLARSGLMACK